MLKKLRFKFVLFSMTIVTILLSLIFWLLFFSTKRNISFENMQMMESMAMNPQKMLPPNGPQSQDDIRIPYFRIRLTDDNEIEDIQGNFFDLSDVASIEDLVSTVMDEDQRDGYINQYNLVYRTFDTPDGKCIVFADTANERNMARIMVKTFAVVGGIAFILFLGLSILMARWAVKPVEVAWNQQKQFIADASHELKTPLTVIMTNAELLGEDKCSSVDRKQFSGNILTMSKQMRGLVESLLELARIDAGTKTAAHQCFSLSDTVSASAMTFEPVFFEKGLTFSYDIEDNVKINGNASQLKQLVDILLDNASKYSSSNGEIVLTLKSLSKRQCSIEVKNTGDNISPEDLRNLFKRFYRADKARAMNHSYGLGLSIAQSICDEHKGKISAQSTNGWNIFTVILPKEET